jgi:hypothetical protein
MISVNASLLRAYSHELACKSSFHTVAFFILIGFLGVFGWLCIFAVLFTAAVKRFVILMDSGQASTFDDD